MNKPVAWIGKNELQFGFTDTRVTNDKESWDDIPLYTHPVKKLTLTDEEIAVIWANYGVPMTGMDFKKVVEAILQKANNG